MVSPAQEWSLPFLRRVADSSHKPRVATLNVFEIAGFPRRETVASNVLAFFFDPNRPHGLGSLFVDALLTEFDGSRHFGRPGPRFPVSASTGFPAAGYRGSSDWTVVTEAATSARNRIDILLTNESLDVAIVIENKMDAAFANPLEDYVGHASRRFATVLSVLLAPTRQTIHRVSSQDRAWLSVSLTFDELFARVRRESLQTAADVEPRVIDLLDQFQENLSAKEVAMSKQADLERVLRFWEAVGDEPNVLPEFFGALAAVSQALKRRSEAFRDEIVARMGKDLGLTSTFVSAGFDHKWGVRDGLVTVVWVGFALSSGITVELIVGGDPVDPNLLSAKAYLTENGPGDLLAGYSRVPLRATLSGPESVLAHEFVELIRQVHSEVGSA